MPDVMEAPSTDLIGDAIDEALGGAPEVEDAEAPSSELFSEDEADADGDGTPEVTDEIDPDSSYKLTDEGKALVVPKQDFQILKGMREYAEPIQEMFPTVGDAKIAYQEALDLRAIRADFTNGSDSDIDAMLGYLAGRDEADPTLQQQFRQSFLRMSERFPEFIQGIDKNAYSSLESSVIKAKTEALYQKAARSNNPDDVYEAQMFEWLTNNRQHRTELPTHDPAKEAHEAFERDRKQVEQQKQDMLNRDWQAFDAAAVNGAKFKEYWKMIDAELEPLKGQYTDRHIQSLRRDISNDLITTLGKDREWARGHNIEYGNIKSAYATAWMNRQSVDGLQPRTTKFQTEFLTKARRYLPSISKQVLDQTRLPAVNAPKPKPQPQKGTPAKPAAAAAKNGVGRPQKQDDVWGGAFS